MTLGTRLAKLSDTQADQGYIQTNRSYLTDSALRSIILNEWHDSLKLDLLIMRFKSFHWFSHHGISNCNLSDIFARARLV